MKDQILKLFVLLLIFLSSVASRSQMMPQLQNETTRDSAPVQIQKEAESGKTSDEVHEYQVRIPPPFVEEFAGIPRPPRRWPDKTREIREVNTNTNTRGRVVHPTPSCDDYVKPCSCCCKSCWEFSFQNLKHCFNSCSSKYENCSCHKSRFHPLDFKKGGFLERKG